MEGRGIYCLYNEKNLPIIKKEKLVDR